MVKYKNYKEAMPVLKDWLATQPHLPIIEESQMKAFVTFCDGDLEEAKDLIEKHYSFRTNNPQIFRNRDTDSEAFKNLDEILDIVLLPDVTPDNHRIVVYRMRSPDTTHYNYAEQVRLVTLYFDALIRADKSEVNPNGIYIIMDLKEVTLQHLAKVDFSAVRVLVKFMEELNNIKIPRSHIVNCPQVLGRILTLAKTFLSDKTIKKFVIHDTNPEGLFDYISRDILPVELNGTKGTIDDLKKENEKLLKSNRDYIMDDKYWLVDESKRPLSSRRPQFDGMQGNFKTLSVD